MREEVYFKLVKHNITLTEVQGILCFDQQKWNLFGLVEHRVDAEGIEAARANPVADSIHKEMFTELREALKLPPLQFLAKWKTIQGWTHSMTEAWPSGFNETIEQRVWGLCGRVDQGNVVTINFRRSA